MLRVGLGAGRDENENASSLISFTNRHIIRRVLHVVHYQLHSRHGPSIWTTTTSQREASSTGIPGQSSHGGDFEEFPPQYCPCALHSCVPLVSVTIIITPQNVVADPGRAVRPLLHTYRTPIAFTPAIPWGTMTTQPSAGAGYHVSLHRRRAGVIRTSICVPRVAIQVIPGRI